MMVLTHGLSGYVCGRVAMPVLRRVSPLSPGTMSWALVLGAMVPDADIVTRVALGRSAYFSAAWYGHRQFSHSILGTFLLAGLLAAGGFAPALRSRGLGRAGLAWIWGCLWCGGLLHLAGDLPTPGRPLPLLWPLAQTFGAWSHIGWFTPYLWWMFLTAVPAAAALRWIGARLVARGLFRAGIAVAGAAWIVYAAAAYRWTQYLFTTRYESAAQYAALQRRLLPEPLVELSGQWVHAAWSWLTG
ncbi:MAG: metal-dependent hydrolase [SAR324 cluster bacterium]